MVRGRMSAKGITVTPNRYMYMGGDFKQVVTDYERQLLRHQCVVERYEVCKIAQHEPHIYREGFLWHRKVHCPGVPAKRKSHRHFFRLTRVLKGRDTVFWNEAVSGEMVAWQCECEAYLMSRRDVLKEAMLPNWGKVEQVWPG
jgi:hypothetical protein